MQFIYNKTIILAHTLNHSSDFYRVNTIYLPEMEGINKGMLFIDNHTHVWPIPEHENPHDATGI
jgi:hypothetical protein